MTGTADRLVVPEAAAVADHQHGVGSQDRDVVGDGLRVRRPDTDVDDRHAVAAGTHVVPRGHLHAVAVGSDRIGEPLAERLDVHGVVGEDDVALEHRDGGSRVVAQAIDRQRHPLGREQEELLGPQIPLGLVERREQRGIVERERRARRAHLDLGAECEQPAELALEVAPDGDGAGELTGEARVVLRPGPNDLHHRVAAVEVDRLERIAQRRGGVGHRRAAQVRAVGGVVSGTVVHHRDPSTTTRTLDDDTAIRRPRNRLSRRVRESLDS
jgi:hypothetical protein